MAENSVDITSDVVREAALQYQEKALIPLIEDVAEWLTKVTGVAVDPGPSFMDDLDNGVVLCNLINVIQNHQKAGDKEKIKYKKDATKGGWHARDNAACFIMWCKRFKIKDELLFESDGLVTHKQKREVVLCLLELSRYAARYGIEPPGLVKLEKEIESDELMLKRMQSGKADLSKMVGARDPRSKMSGLDSEVKLLADQCSCKPALHVEKLSEGIYTVGDKRCLVRQFKGKHIMVRVGGGWDTLEHYLSCHDPCRISLLRKHGGVEEVLSVVPLSQSGIMNAGNSCVSEQRFLHVKGRYTKT